MGTYKATISVRYAETDKMGVAHHASYLLWFELARTGLLRESGHPYRDMESAHVLLPVIEYNCRLVQGAAYDDTVSIETSVRELRSRVVSFGYRAFRGTTLLAEGWTRHVCVDGDNHPRRLPADVAEALRPYRIDVLT